MVIGVSAAWTIRLSSSGPETFQGSLFSLISSLIASSMGGHLCITLSRTRVRGGEYNTWSHVCIEGMSGQRLVRDRGIDGLSCRFNRANQYEFGAWARAALLK
jgi:hypothetical protein